MTKYEVLVSETARRQLRALPNEVGARIRRALRKARADPFRGVKRLKGPKRDYFRLRVGDYRVIYTMKGGRILVAKILHRRVAYSWLD